MNETPEQNLRLLEAILFASADPLTQKSLVHRLPEGCDVVALLAKLKEDYTNRGVHLIQSGGSWAFRTADDLRPVLDKEIEVARKLGRATVETLAIIAYHQPVTRAEIEEIRGVSLSKGTLDTLFEQGWVHPRGRRKTPGRPVTWGTTDAFLDHFGLENITDLPGMDELKAAGLLDARPAIDAYRVTGDLSEAADRVDVGEAPEAPEEQEDEGILHEASHLLDQDENMDDQPLDPNGD